MFLHLKNILTADELAHARSLLGETAPWVNGARSAGEQAVQHKNNQQLAQDSDAARELQALVLQAVQRDVRERFGVELTPEPVFVGA